MTPSTGMLPPTRSAHGLREVQHVAMRHRALLAGIWKTQVPRTGQSATVQGELLRAVAKLEDEAVRNGNVNWGSGHRHLIAFLRRTLLESDVLDAEARQVVSEDLDRVGDDEHPLTDQDAWIRLHDAVGEWCLAHPDPVAREHDPTLRI